MRSPRRIGAGGWFLRAYAAGFGAVFGMLSAMCLGGLFLLALASFATAWLSAGGPIEFDLSGNDSPASPNALSYPPAVTSAPAPYQSLHESVQAAQYEAADYPSPATSSSPYSTPYHNPYSSPPVRSLPPSPAELTPSAPAVIPSPTSAPDISSPAALAPATEAPEAINSKSEAVPEPPSDDKQADPSDNKSLPSAEADEDNNQDNNETPVSDDSKD